MKRLKPDGLIAVALSLVSVLPRLPYLTEIPLSGDFLKQTIYAMQIRPGGFMPLVGNDPYAGALYSYIIAGSLKVLGISPFTAYIAQLFMGALTIGLTYLLARAMGLSWPWAGLVGLLMTANPHHILLNSHSPGTVYIIPLFSTAFLIALVVAVRRESGPWLIAAGALLGLALQTNPIPALMLPGVAVWFLLQRKSSIGLRTRWPYLAALALVLAYSPVIIYNLQTNLPILYWAETRDYLWQPKPSSSSYLPNLWRLILQLCRQVSGVVEGQENIQSLIGLPIVLSLWAIAGLVQAARKGISLPALAVASQVIVMPWWSNHYGMLVELRLTMQLAPLMAVGMGVLAADMWTFLRVRAQAARVAPFANWAIGLALVLLSLSPLVTVAQYYQHQVAAGETNVPYSVFFEEFEQQWQGEKILISGLTFFDHSEYLLAMNQIPYEVVPFERVQERLATGQQTGRVTLVLDDADVPNLKLRVNLVPWRSPAIEANHRLTNCRWYTIADAQNAKPTFVLGQGESLPSDARAMQVNLADQLGLVASRQRANRLNPGDTLVVDIYWKANRMLADDLTSFVHLVWPEGQLVAQQDQELGRGFYPTHYWQPGEIVHERYELALPRDAPVGDYVIQAGAYNFPSLERLRVVSSTVPAQNDVITLGTLHVGR